MINLINLPDLVIDRIIFNNLSYEDVFRLKLTCKKLKQFIDQRQCKNLWIYLKNYPYYNRLFYSNELVRHSNSLKIFNLIVLKKFLTFKTFEHIQKLTFYFHNYWPVKVKISELKFNLNQFNFFKQLKHLEMDQMARVSGKLNLNNLEILFINTRYISNFEIDCPRLKALKLSDGARPTIHNTIKLTYLSIGCLFKYSIDKDDQMYSLSNKRNFTLIERNPHEIVDYLKDLLKNCVNLSVIVLELIDHLNLILIEMNEGRIKFKFLKEIRLQSCQNYSKVNLLIELLSKMNQTTKYIKIYLNNFEMMKEDWISLSNFNFKSIEYNPFKMLNENSRTLNLLYSNIDYFKIDNRKNLNLQQLANYNWDNVCSLNLYGSLNNLKKEESRKLFIYFPNLIELCLTNYLLDHQWTNVGTAFQCLFKLKRLCLKGIEFQFDDFKYFFHSLINFNNLEYIEVDWIRPNWIFFKEDIRYLFENSIKLEIIRFYKSNNLKKSYNSKEVTKKIQIDMIKLNDKYLLIVEETKFGWFQAINGCFKCKKIIFNHVYSMIEKSEIFFNLAMNNCEMVI